MLTRKEAKSIISRNQPAIVELRKRGVSKLLVEGIVKDLVEAKVKQNLQGYGYSNVIKNRFGKTVVWLERGKIKYNTTITVRAQCAVMQE